MRWTPAERLDGRVVAVVGGSGGIGAAVARLLSRRGARLAISYHSRAEAAAALVAELPRVEAGPHVMAHAALDHSETLEAFAALVAAEAGRCDVLVNTAGATQAVPHGDLPGLDDALIDRVFALNWRGPFAAVRAFAPLLRASGDGLVVNVSSISGSTAKGSNIAYCGAKAAVDNMTMALARVLAPQVRVVSLAPAAVATDFVPGRGRAAVEAQAAETPLKRVAEPEHVAGAVLACLTHLPLTTGSVLQLDGGRHL